MSIKALEKVLKALANKRRLAILKYLKGNREAPVAEIAEELPLSFRSTSKHLAVLFAADVVEKSQRSSQIFYRLAREQGQAAHKIIALL